MIPTYEIFADGKRVTPLFAGRLLNLEINDEAGEKSDSLKITIEDHLHEIELPKTETELAVSIGYEGQPLREMGIFSVDHVQLSGPPSAISITASGCPFVKTKTFESLKSKKTRSWEVETTLGSVLSKIGNEHGLNPAISSELAAITIPHTDQTDESDINLLTRLAKNYGAVVKPTFGNIAFLPASAGKSKSGSQLARITIDESEISRWTATMPERAIYNTVTARWHDYATGQPTEVKAGDGNPVHSLKTIFADEATAYAAAVAALEEYARSSGEITLQLLGRPEIIAETPITLTGIRTGADGDWIVKSATHTISRSGYTTTLRGEIPKN